MHADTSLNTGLLVGTQDEFIWTEGASVPRSLIQVQDAIGLGLKLRVAREDPRPMVPRTQGILMKPPPYGTPTDLGDDAPVHDFFGNVGGTEARQRNSAFARQLTGQGLNLHHDLRGKNREGARSVVDPPDRIAVADKSACAIC